jgi:DNA-3-methyladenine glycosylase II
MPRISFELTPRPPFRLDLTARVLQRRTDNAVDRFDAGTYRRTLAIDGAAIDLAVTQHGTVERPILLVEASGSGVDETTQHAAAGMLERLLGLSVNLDGFYELAAADRQLGPLAGRFRGVRPPRFPSVFEVLINAIACQQITLTLGIRLLNSVVQRFGRRAHHSTAAAHAFPRPQDLADVAPETLRPFGFSGQKARTIVTLAQQVTSGELDLEALAELDDEPALTRLLALRGIGRWSAEYALLRGLGRIHIFPRGDAGARGSLSRWLGCKKPLDYDGVARTVKRWHPYAGFVYFHLLLMGLAAAGVVE